MVNNSTECSQSKFIDDDNYNNNNNAIMHRRPINA